MADLTYQKFVKRWKEVTDLPPQDVGIFTPLYKWMTSKLKVKPWPALGLLGIGMVIIVYFLIGSSITWIVSLLQRGF